MPNIHTSNLILTLDSYKHSHPFVTPPGTEYDYAYIESRGGLYERTLFFGLQMYIKDYLSSPISHYDIDEAESYIVPHGEPFYREGWEHIVNKHGGYLPLEISALPEGTVVNTKTPLLAMVNTDPKCAWLPSGMETPVQRGVWYPTTVSTRSFHLKQKIRKAFQISSDSSPEQIEFKLHDFGARAATSHESAAIGGVSSMVNFKGSDTVEGLVYARKFYGEYMAANSIPAAEHAKITNWGREREDDGYLAWLDTFLKPGKIVAVVSDSYNLMRVVNYVWGGRFRDRIMNSGGTLVVRPDSGDPTIVPVDVIQALSLSFGYTINSKGYKVLPDCIRVIQGDGLNDETIDQLFANLHSAGFSIDNLALGVGGWIMQQLNRDTQKVAQKLSATCVNGVWRDVYKDPITDPGKRSKTGRFAVVEVDGILKTVNLVGNTLPNLLRPVWRNGEFVVEQKLADIRLIANSYGEKLALAA